MLLYFVQNVFFESKIVLLCVIIAIQHSSSSKTSARKTQLAKQNRGRKQPLHKTSCRKFPVKLVITLSSRVFFLLSKPPNKSFYLCSRGSFLRKFYANFEKKGLGGNGFGTYMYH